MTIYEVYACKFQEEKNTTMNKKRKKERQQKKKEKSVNRKNKNITQKCKKDQIKISIPKILKQKINFKDLKTKQNNKMILKLLKTN